MTIKIILLLFFLEFSKFNFGTIKLNSRFISAESNFNRSNTNSKSSELQ